MDAPNRQSGEPAMCPVCGEAHPECDQAILDGMALSAIHEAETRLSPEGVETLRMVDYAVNELPGGVVDAWDSAENVKHLPAYEIRVIETYLARKTLIDSAYGELYES